MDYGESSINPSFPSTGVSDVPISDNRKKEEEAEAADDFRREMKLEESIEDHLAGIGSTVDDDDEVDYYDDNDDDDPHSDSHEESMDNSLRNSKIDAEQSSTEAPIVCEEQTLPPADSSSDSQGNDFEDYHNDSEDISNVCSNRRPSIHDSSSPHSLSSHHLSSSPANHLVDHSEVNFSEVYHNDASNIYNNHNKTGDESKDENTSQFHSKTEDNEQQFGLSDVASKDRAKYSKNKTLYASESPLASSYQAGNALKKNETDWKEKYRVNELHELLTSRTEELKRVQNENIRFMNEIKSLQLKLSHIESEKDQFSKCLQLSKRSLDEYRTENNELKGKSAAIEHQMSAEKNAKENALSKLQIAEITIQSLEQQINALSRSENAVRLRDQTESIINDLKLRHKKEVLQLKEEIDELQQRLHSKNKESENMQSTIIQLQRRYEELQLEKTDTFNKISASLEASQKQCQNLLESGTIQEVSLLKLQNKQLLEEKSKLEKHTSALKDEVKLLQNELQTYEALKKLEVENENKSAQATNEKSSLSSPKERSLKAELQKSLKNLQSLRSQNKSLKEKLDELNSQLPLFEEKAKLFESRYKESVLKIKELEEKLAETLPLGSIRAVEHSNQISVLQNELAEVKKKLQDVSEKLKYSTSKEEELIKENKKLISQISEMLKSHKSEKIKAIEQCRKKHVEFHESSVKKLKHELRSKAEAELKNVRLQFENQIAGLEKQIKSLHDELYDSKNQYVKIYEENQLLLSKLDSISKPKERAEIEKEVHSEYEQKLHELKKKQVEEVNNYKTQLECEIDNFKKNWTEEKMKVVQEFVNKTKQQLEEEFTLEQSKMNAEKEKILKECQENICDLKQQFEVEKRKLQMESQQKINDVMLQFEAEKKRIVTDCQAKVDAVKQQSKAEKDDLNTRLKELEQSHQIEINTIKQKYQNMISNIEAETDILKESLQRRSGESKTIQSLQLELANHRKAWEKERLDFVENQRTIDAKLANALEMEKKLKEKVKRYHKYVSSLKKKYLEEIKKHQIENGKLKKLIADKDNQFLAIKEQYDLKVLKEDEDFKKQFVRNSHCQTEEKFVPENTLINIHAMFIESLKKIADEIKHYLQDSKKREAEKLKKALIFYRDSLIEDVFRDSDIFKQNFFNPLSNVNIHSGSSSRDHLVSNSSSTDNLVHHNKQTKIPSIPSDLNSANVLRNARSTPDSRNRFGDVSFDYIPIIPDSALTSTKVKEYFMPTGLFSRQNIFPERDSPSSIIN